MSLAPCKTTKNDGYLIVYFNSKGDVLMLVFNTETDTPENPQEEATTAIVVDAESGAVKSRKGVGGRPPASDFEVRDQECHVWLNISEVSIARELMDMLGLPNTAELFRTLLQQEAVRRKSDLKKFRKDRVPIATAETEPEENSQTTESGSDDYSI